MLPKLTLVLGGARSGKSAFAERLVLHSGARPVYLATAQAFDDEMAERIALHRARRQSDGWDTIEEPTGLGPHLLARRDTEAVLLDCATLWLSNLIMAGADVVDASACLLRDLRACPAAVVVVSNEVGLGVVPDNAMARGFRDAQGRLNQELAAQAGLVVNVIAGLPQVLKGQMPGGGA